MEEFRKKLDFFYGTQPQKFYFFKLPKFLFFRSPWSGILSPGALILYSVFLDRMQLSLRNSWVDDEDRVYINYKMDALAEDLQWTEYAIRKYMKELVDQGLIQNKRQGLNRAARIYVMDFTAGREVMDPDIPEETSVENPELRRIEDPDRKPSDLRMVTDPETTAIPDAGLQAVEGSETLISANADPELRTYEAPEVRTYEDPEVRTYEAPEVRTYEGPEVRTYEDPDLRTFAGPNNIYIYI